jgi:hypothetical protein
VVQILNGVGLSPGLCVVSGLHQVGALELQKQVLLRVQRRACQHLGDPNRLKDLKDVDFLLELAFCIFKATEGSRGFKSIFLETVRQQRVEIHEDEFFGFDGAAQRGATVPNTHHDLEDAVRRHLVVLVDLLLELLVVRAFCLVDCDVGQSFFLGNLKFKRGFGFRAGGAGRGHAVLCG